MPPPSINFTGWNEKPRYDKVQHHIVWALTARSQDSENINFNTRLLGREGFLSFNLLCDPTQLARLKPGADQMLSKVQFVSGKRYADFKKGVDKEAGYGVAALVIGGTLAAKAVKAGLLAKFFKVLIGLLMQATDPGVFKLSRDLFSYEPYGLVVRRNDADFRLAADRALAELYRTGRVEQVYAQWFGKAGLRPSEALIAMYSFGALPE